MNKYLFLDVDGVLNTRPGSLDDGKLELLQKIHKATGCLFVLSSTWRKYAPQATRLQHAMSKYGLRIKDATPVLEIPVNGLIHAKPRWMEIKSWLVENQEQCLPQIVIVDDESDMGDFNFYHVRTQSDTGLTQELADEIIKRLNA